MNKETLESILKNAEDHRNGLVRGDFDLKSILTHLLTVEIERIRYELDGKKDTANQIYKWRL